MSNWSFLTGVPHGPVLPAAALGVATLAALLPLTCGAPPAGPVALIFPPWWSESHTMAAASRAGRIVGLGAPHVVVVAPIEGRRRAALRRTGALFFANPRAASACRPPAI